MKLLSVSLLTLLAFFAQARQSHGLGNNEPGSPITMNCVFMFLMMALFIAGVLFLLSNRRRNINDKNNSEKNS
ncbi:MAG: hypothetical protein V4722_08110 [Bacteroidota bacterium]